MENNKKKKWLHSKAVRIILPAVLLFLSGYFFNSLTHKSSTTDAAAQPVSQKWTCSMHPEIIRDKPGKCPKCGMDLIPLATTAAVDTKAWQMTISEEAAKLMEIETSLVQRKFVTNQIRLVGKIDYDETRLKNITAWVPGRIDRLYVDFTGIAVNKGDHMVYLYSPQLISAQAEFLQAVRAARNIKTTTSTLINNATLATLKAAREKLRLLGLDTQQIENIEKANKTQTHITINAPMSGVVIHKNANEGMYVETGTAIYKIADLSRLWVMLDAYESDLLWIRYGQKVEFTTRAYPGQVFKGRISFIDPILNDKTRTTKIRVNVDNSQGKLKPNMLVSALIQTRVVGAGKIMAPQMAGKWICSMHPDIVKETKGLCDICGMNLVTAESLGYFKASEPDKAPLVIPASAALVTGKRAVVYIRLPQTEIPTYEGRQIVLGPRAGDYYIVEAGLEPGEIVVTNGNFKIDSAMQIQAKPCMMNPQNLQD